METFRKIIIGTYIGAVSAIGAIFLIMAGHIIFGSLNPGAPPSVQLIGFLSSALIGIGLLIYANSVYENNF